jgi:Cu-processing system permease protein
MDLGIVTTLAAKEIRDSLRNRWFILYTIAFTGLALALSWLSLAGSGSSGFAGFGRTTAGLVNLVLLVVPLMALTAGASSVAGERERGTLAYLLSQPVNRGEVLAGKYVGLAVALLASLALGFGASALILVAGGGAGDAGAYLLLVLLTFALALSMLSVGFVVSVLAVRTSAAAGIALSLWLVFAFGTDLGLMGSAVAFRLHVADLFHLALGNPLQVFKMAVLGSVSSSLDVLGPAGMYALQTYGDSLRLVWGASLGVWIVLPLAAAVLVFRRRGVS